MSAPHEHRTNGPRSAETQASPTPQPRPLWAALLDFQAGLRVLKRNQRNEFTGSDYLDMAGLLEAIGPALTKAGLVLIQSPTLSASEDSRYAVELLTRIVHAASGEELANTFRCPVRTPDAQAVGSAVSYARRYAAMALLGLASERDSADDDGNAASDRRPEPDGRGDRRSTAGPRKTRLPPVRSSPPAAPDRGAGGNVNARRGAQEPPAAGDSDRPTKDEWGAYGGLAAQWRGQRPSRDAVLAWAEGWRRTKGAPRITGLLLREAVTRLRLAINAPTDPPGSNAARAEWERLRADAHEASGALADGSDPLPSEDEGAS